MNVSLDGAPVRFTLRSPRLLLIDPLALDGLRDQLRELDPSAPGEPEATIATLSDYGLRIGLHDLSDFEPGTFEIDRHAFESVDEDTVDPRVFEIDSGTLVVIDLTALAAVAGALTWERYDAWLRSPVGDDRVLEAIKADAGGTCFAILTSDADSPFSGDGTFRLRPGSPRRIDPQ